MRGLGCAGLAAGTLAFGGCSLLYSLDSSSDGGVGDPADGSGTADGSQRDGGGSRTHLSITLQLGPVGDAIPIPLTLNADVVDLGAVDNPRTDLDFRDSEGISLPFEVTQWSAKGALVWVLVAEASQGGETTELTLQVAPNVRDEPAVPTDVWTDFAGVWHMASDPGIEVDAAGQRADAASSTPAPATVDGVFDQALFFDGSQRILIAGEATDDSRRLKARGAGTVEAWVTFDDTPAPAQVIAARAFGLSAGQASWAFGNCDSGGDSDSYCMVLFDTTEFDAAYSALATVGVDSNDTTWYYLVSTWDRADTSTDRIRYTVDGTISGSPGLRSHSAAPIEDVTRPLTIGGIGASDDDATTHYGHSGRIDEVRISNHRRSAVWIDAQHRALRAPESFAVFTAM